LDYDRLKTEGSMQWPVSEFRHQGTKRLFEDRKFYTPNQKATFNVPYSVVNASIGTDKNYPLILTTGRIRDQWHTMTKTGKVARLQTHYPQPRIEMNPVDAYIHHLKDGDICEVNSRNGQVRLKVKLTDTVREGVLFIPMHWGKILQSDLNRVNNLTNTIVDPQSKEPDFKFTAVAISKYSKPQDKIVVIGAGAAAFRFIQNYRELNTTDTIEVFSQEEHLFYNRVLLPEYITEELTWEQLQKVKKEELQKLKINIHYNNSIQKI